MKKSILYICISLLIIFLATGIAYFVIHKKQNHINQPELTQNKTVHIVFTTDKAYIKYLKVAIYSAIANKKPDSVYDINILCVDLNENERKIFKKYETKNVTVKTIPVEEKDLNFGKFKILNERVSRADLFKFFMPEIFKDLNKILYLDADILILGDLLDLYNTDITNYYLGAVLKYSPNTKVIHTPFRKVKLYYEYNCGVMLLNLDKMRKNNITAKLIKAKEKDKLKILMTQSAFNKVMPTKCIFKLDPKYNFYARLENDYDFKYFELKKIYSPYTDDINNLAQMQKRAVIVHFAGPLKPWYDNDVKQLFDSIEWRKYALRDNPDWKSDGVKIHYLEY